MVDILSDIDIEFDKLKDHLRWWEKRRLWFNGIVLLAGILPFLIRGQFNRFGGDLIFPALAWAFICNFCYCLGWGVSILSIHYGNKNSVPTRGRTILFIVGAFLTVLVTVLGSNLLFGYGF